MLRPILVVSSFFVPDYLIMLAVSNIILHVSPFIWKLTKKRKSALKKYSCINHRKKIKWKSTKNVKHYFGFVINYVGKQKSNKKKYTGFFNIMAIMNFKGLSLKDKIWGKCKVSKDEQKRFNCIFYNDLYLRKVLMKSMTFTY